MCHAVAESSRRYAMCPFILFCMWDVDTREQAVQPCIMKNKYKILRAAARRAGDETKWCATINSYSVDPRACVSWRRFIRRMSEFRHRSCHAGRNEQVRQAHDRGAAWHGTARRARLWCVCALAIRYLTLSDTHRTPDNEGASPAAGLQRNQSLRTTGTTLSVASEAASIGTF